MEVIIGQSPELIRQAQIIRHQVFTLEQHIPKELDLDGLDEAAFHALVTEQNKAIATARLVVNADDSSVMARVAVIEEFRGSGIASTVVKALIEHAKTIGVNSIELHAHSYLRNYYEKFGFEFIQEVEIVGEHQLIEMQHKIVRT